MKINEAIKKLNQEAIILLINKAKDVFKNNLIIIDKLVKDSDEGIIVTINHPYVAFKRILKSNKIDTKNIFFIDLISATVSNESEKSDECLFVNAPNDLTALSIAIDQLLNVMKKENKYIFIDSLSTFLIYNNKKIVTEFVHFLVTKIRMHKIKGVIMSIEEEVGEGFINQITSFTDKTIKID